MRKADQCCRCDQFRAVPPADLVAPISQALNLIDLPDGHHYLLTKIQQAGCDVVAEPAGVAGHKPY